MPVKSAKQLRLMFAAMHGKSKKVSKKVAKEFIEATPREKLKSLARKRKRK